MVGGGPAAHRLVEALTDRNEASLRISLFTEEALAPYDRVALSKRFEDRENNLLLGDESLWQNPQVQLHTSTAIAAMDAEAKTITDSSGAVHHYDDVVLATGSSATRPPIDGDQHIAVYRTLDDVDWLVDEVRRLAEELGRTPRCTVIGGGLLGLEAAGGLKGHGADVTIVHSREYLMNAQLDEGGGGP